MNVTGRQRYRGAEGQKRQTRFLLQDVPHSVCAGKLPEGHHHSVAGGFACVQRHGYTKIIPSGNLPCSFCPFVLMYLYSCLGDFALKGQDGGNRGQRRRCARGERCPHNNATLKRVA